MPSKETLYHIVDGAVEFDSSLVEDALKHPKEWARTPWPAKKAEPSGEALDELVLRHRGRGSYSIMRGEVEVAEGLTKEEGEAKLAEMLAA